MWPMQTSRYCAPFVLSIPQVPLVMQRVQGVCPSLDGGGPRVLTLMQHRHYTREPWQGVNTMKEGVQSTSVSTSNHSSSAQHRGYKVIVVFFMELNISQPNLHQHFLTCTVTMLHVLCATLQLALPRSPYQQGHHVLLHGQGNTTATSWLIDLILITNQEFQFVSMSMQNQWLGVQGVIFAHCSTS